MRTIIHFQVRTQLLAVDARRSDFVTIPAGSIIETKDDLLEPGLHEVRYRGENVLVFARDIHERTQQVSVASA